MRKLWRIIRRPFYHISMVKHPDLGYGIRKRILFFTSYKKLTVSPSGRLARGRLARGWWTSESSLFPACWHNDIHHVHRIYRQLTPLDHITKITDDTDVAQEILRG